MWVVGLLLGYALVLYGLRDQLGPAGVDFGAALYFAGTSLFTLGYGDVVATGGAARFVALFAAANGLVLVALIVTFLFSLYGSFQRREVLVVSLDARAGAPPSGMRFLETYAAEGMLEDLGPQLRDWELWCAEVLDNHLAYPVLAYFRSSHDDESWIGALGAVLDAATLLSTTVEGGPHGQAHMTQAAGAHLVEDLARFFGVEESREVGVERQEYEEARSTLGAAGYRLRDADLAWRDFSALRTGYAGALNALAQYWAVPPARWVGDRSHVHHAKPEPKRS